LPISNGIFWVADVGGAKVGSTVVVQGPGQHGLGGVIGAKEAGAGCVIAIGLSQDERRLAVAEELGADYTLRADVDNVVEAVRDITHGKMADMVLNVAGSVAALEMSFDLAGDRATIVCSAYPREPVRGMEKINGKRLTVKGIGGRDQRSARAAIRLVESGKYPFEKMSTHTFTLEDANLALQATGREGEFEDAIHVTVVPN
jgi:threonine dehydrogenase-like Zn-dependent dehydrogenase